MTVRNLLVHKEGIVIKNVITEIGKIGKFKDSAHFCYCAYIVRSAHLEILGFPMGGAY